MFQSIGGGAGASLAASNSVTDQIESVPPPLLPALPPRPPYGTDL